MTIQFYKVKIKNIIRETPKAVTVVFDIPSDLKSNFSYKAGQYLTIRINSEGRDERRAYSACSSPYANEDLAVTVKEVENGFVSTYINNKLQIGEIVDLMPPLGHFTIEPYERNERKVVLIGAGSGITPLMSILKSLLIVEKKSEILLIYSNRNEENVIFAKELAELQAQYSNFSLISIYSQPINTEKKQEKITDVLLKNVLQDRLNDKLSYANYFICGPRGMMETANDTLLALGVSKERIHKESFVAAEKTDSDKIDEEVTNADIHSIKVRLYGEETEIPIETDETILVAGMRASLDPPFSCQIGACSTCRAKLVSGKVKMDDYDALTDSEIEQGYILTCTAHPLTNDVLVDYDN